MDGEKWVGDLHILPFFPSFQRRLSRNSSFQLVLLKHLSQKFSWSIFLRTSSEANILPINFFEESILLRTFSKEFILPRSSSKEFILSRRFILWMSSSLQWLLPLLMMLYLRLITMKLLLLHTWWRYFLMLSVVKDPTEGSNGIFGDRLWHNSRLCLSRIVNSFGESRNWFYRYIVGILIIQILMEPYSSRVCQVQGFIGDWANESD